MTGIVTANAVGRHGLGSLDGALNVGMNALVGVAMLGVGAAYGKPYFTTAGKVALAATAVGVGVGLLTTDAKLVPEVRLTVDFED
jgi:hypothetical protein